MSYKKSFLCIAWVLMFHNAFSQIRWELKGGVQYSNIMAKDRDGNKAGTHSAAGLYLGLGAKIPVANHFLVHPSLVSARRGFNINGVSQVLWWGSDLKVRTSYIELPVDFLFTAKIGPGNLVAGAGPYAGYGVGGKWKTSEVVVIGDIVTSDKGEVNFQDDASYGGDRSFVYARPWDYGVHLKAGYALFNRYAVSFEMQQGTANIEPRWGNYETGGTVKNKAWGLVLSYTF